MPRVHTITARATRKEGRGRPSCTGCHKPIEVGEKAYKWSRRFGRSSSTYYRHTACGFPRPTELSSRKTAQVEEAVGDATTAIDAWTPELGEMTTGEEPTTFELDCSDVESALEDVAGVAEEVGGEYESGADSMPDALSQGEQAEAMRSVAGELADWAGEVRDWSPDTTSVDLPDRDGYSDDEEGLAAWREDAEAAIEEAADAVREDAKGKFEDMPEYQG